MKTVWNYLISMAESIGRARAASHYTRMGRSDLARKIMLEN